MVDEGCNDKFGTETLRYKILTFSFIRNKIPLPVPLLKGILPCLWYMFYLRQSQKS